MKTWRQKRSSKTKNGNAQDASTLLQAISTVITKSEKHTYRQMAFNTKPAITRTFIWVVTISRIPDREAKKSRIPCPNFGKSRFPESSQIPNPVKIFWVFPNPAPYFGRIPDPENTLPHPCWLYSQTFETLVIVAAVEWFGLQKWALSVSITTSSSYYPSAPSRCRNIFYFYFWKLERFKFQTWANRKMCRVHRANHFRICLSGQDKICSNLIVFNSASDWLIWKKSLKFCLGGHGSCSRTVKRS